MDVRYFYGITPTPQQKYAFCLTEEELGATPEWGMDELNPPLPVRSAMEIGWRRLLDFVNPENKIEWELTSIELVESLGVPRWYYLLKFKQLRDQQGEWLVIMGKPFFLEIVVLMNGQTLEPIDEQALDEHRSHGCDLHWMQIPPKNSN